jgi:mono/diheme cytochrome c family protein
MKDFKRNILGFTLLLVLVGGALLYANRSQAKRTVQIDTSQNAQLALGETIYQANCVACHGIDGAGYAQKGLPAPAINGTEHAWHHPDEQILALLQQGGNLMPAVGANWSNQEREAVWAYVKQWWTPQQRKAQSGTIGE